MALTHPPRSVSRRSSVDRRIGVGGLLLAVVVLLGLTAGGVDVSAEAPKAVAANAANGTISGAVTAANSGAPLNGAAVLAYDTNGALVTHTSTSAAGTYSLTDLPPGNYHVRTIAAGFVPLNYIAELYDDIQCWGCDVTTGAVVAVSSGGTTTGIDFALNVGGVIGGTVTDALTGSPLAGMSVRIYNSTATIATLAFTDSSGAYSVLGLPTGSYFAHALGTTNHVGELYDNLLCVSQCIVTAGNSISVTAGSTTSNINFALDRAGSLAGTVTDSVSSATLNGVTVAAYATNGAWLASATTSGAGAYTITGLPAGTYHTRTFNRAGYHDEVYDNLLLCFPSCLPTSGAGVSVTAGITTGGVDFALTPGSELVKNGDFSNSTTFWSLFALPDISYIVWEVTDGVFRYYRVPPPPGTVNQAVILQGTGAALSAATPLIAQFDIGNASPVRRRISVVIHDGDFSDLTVCTFWLAPNAPRARYGMRTYNTEAWSNATISFYAASADTTGGFYDLDNISLQVAPAAVEERTDCLDPTAPGAPGGPDQANLVANGDFGTGTTSSWSLFGQIVSHVSAGTFGFYRPSPPDPAGVILQPTSVANPSREIVTAQFDLGNSSSVRTRVTVLLHDLDFSDLAACTFWLEPGQAMSTYTMRTFATQQWANATISVYAATVGTAQWTWLDNVTFRRTPGQATVGTSCVEPGASSTSAPAPEPSPEPSPLTNDNDETKTTTPAPRASNGPTMVAGVGETAVRSHRRH
jgi:hypothetical protein